MPRCDEYGGVDLRLGHGGGGAGLEHDGGGTRTLSMATAFLCDIVFGLSNLSTGRKTGLDYVL